MAKRIFLCLLLASFFVSYSFSALAETPPTYDQMEYQYMLRRSAMLNELGDWKTWTLEDKARLDQLWLEMGQVQDDFPLHSIPTDKDLPQQEALRMAKEEIGRKFSLDEAALSAYGVRYVFFAFPDPSIHSLWILRFEQDGVAPSTAYEVEIDSVTRAIILCRDLAIEAVPPASERDVPAADDIPMEEAVKLAKEAAEKKRAEAATLGAQLGRHPLTEDALKHFSAHAVFAEESVAGRCWQVTLESPDEILNAYFGFVIVFLDPKTGAVLDIVDGQGTNG